MKLDSLRDLAIYRHTVDGGSLRAAARALNLSPTVVSRRIAHLETTLGTPLLLRTTRTLQVTPRGEQLYRRAVAILNQALEAESELLAAPDTLEGTLRVSLPTAFSAPDFLQAVGALLDANPALILELYYSDQPIDPRTAGVDLLIRAGPLEDSTLVARLLGRATPLMLATPSYVAARGAPETPEDLLHHRCLRFREDRQQDVWRLTDADGLEHAVPVGGNLFCDNSAALTQALYAGLGIGFRATAEARRAVAAGTLVHLLPAYQLAPFLIYATYTRGMRTSTALQAFQSLVASYLTTV